MPRIPEGVLAVSNPKATADRLPVFMLSHRNSSVASTDSMDWPCTNCSFDVLVPRSCDHAEPAPQDDDVGNQKKPPLILLSWFQSPQIGKVVPEVSCRWVNVVDESGKIVPRYRCVSVPLFTHTPFCWTMAVARAFALVHGVKTSVAVVRLL
jgi:hypothetical protein